MVNSDAIILDFDGVIIDSMEECLLISFCVYCQVFFDEGFVLEKIPEEKRKRFVKFRYLVGPAREYSYLWQSIESARSDEDIEGEFYRLKKENAVNVEQYEQKFYNLRNIYQMKNRDSWILLNPMYPGIDKEIRMLLGKTSVFISSTKDEKSIELLCSTYNLPIKDGHIYGKDHGIDKVKHIKRIAKFIPARCENLSFVDDNLAYLKKVRNLGVRCYLAGWGYNSVVIRNEAREVGIQVIDMLEMTGITQ